MGEFEARMALAAKIRRIYKWLNVQVDANVAGILLSGHRIIYGVDVLFEARIITREEFLTYMPKLDYMSNFITKGEE